MGDPFFHLGFTRRLRFYDGMHPFAVQTLVRHPLPAAVTSTLPGLPALDQAQGGFFKRVLGRGRAENLRWEKSLTNSDAPHGDFLMALLQGAETGAMFRLSAALGTLSQRVLVEATRELTAHMDAKERRGTERGAGRIWLQMNVPSLRELGAEWRSAVSLDDPAAHQKILLHVSKALQQAYGEAPSAEILVRWVRALASELRPISERGGLPPQGSVPEHEVRSRFFEGDGVFLERMHHAKERFVFLANELCNAFLIGEPDTEQVREALFESDGTLRQTPERLDLEEEKLRWRDQVCALRADALLRGRNSKPAYYGSQDMPPLPDDASGPHAHQMPPVPKLTQELSLADVELELSGAALPEAPEETQPISLASIEEEHSVATNAGGDDGVPRAPAVTQALSLEDIEEEIAHTTDGVAVGQPSLAEMEIDETDKIPVAPAMTQSLSLEDIEEEISEAKGDDEATVKSPVAPAVTQALSLEDIEEEVYEQIAEAATPVAPALTQALSLEDIEEEISEQMADSATPAAPALTQALSVEDIEEEISSRHFVEVEAGNTDLPPAPEQTQSLDSDDIEEETLDSEVTPDAPTDEAAVASERQSAASAEAQNRSVADENSESNASQEADASELDSSAENQSISAAEALETAPAGDEEATETDLETVTEATASDDAQASATLETTDSVGVENDEPAANAASDSTVENGTDSQELDLERIGSEAISSEVGEHTNPGAASDWEDTTNAGPRPVSIPPSEPESSQDDTEAESSDSAESQPKELAEDEAESSLDAESAAFFAASNAETSDDSSEETIEEAGAPPADDPSALAEDDGAQKAQ